MKRDESWTKDRDPRGILLDRRSLIVSEFANGAAELMPEAAGPRVSGTSIAAHLLATSRRRAMTSKTRRNGQPTETPAPPAKPSKKEQIIALALSGLGDVADIALMTQSRPSYVASVLEDAGLHSGYFDLYTSTSKQMNVYSRFFAGKMGFKDEATARESVNLIDRLYRQFELAGDRAGQHHALQMALTMFDRARWTNKMPEAEIFRKWLVERLNRAPNEAPVVSEASPPAMSRK
jgi:hypothetical protein